MLVFTYHAIMPEFLDFLPAFGLQGHARNFNFSAFYQNKYISDSEKQAAMLELGWSGRGFRLCYNMKSVEPSPSEEAWPWSARQTAIHHSFDAETGRATWVNIKGDQLMKRRIKLATDPKHGFKEMSSFGSVEEAFGCTLATHNLFIQWSTEHLRPYISFLETEVQTLTRPTVMETIEKPLKPDLNGYQTPRTAQSNDWIERRVEKNQRRFTELTTSTSATPYVPASPRPIDHELQALDLQEDSQPDEDKGFSFTHLQDVQNLEEKANEIVLILTNNASILVELRDFYQNLQSTQGWPAKMRKNCKKDILRFRERITSILSEYGRHQVRLAALLHLLDARKSLVCSPNPLFTSLNR